MVPIYSENGKGAGEQSGEGGGKLAEKGCLTDPGEAE
jgi:hypothetical protein